MNLDELLRDTLTDDRWARPVPADTLDGVRRARSRRRARTAVLSTAPVVLLGAGGTAAVTSLGGTPARLGTYADGGVPEGSPVPGITPSFVPQHGHDWLLTSNEARAWNLSHTHPSPGPGQSVVASPAPLGEQSAALLAAVETAGLPEGSTLRREDSVGGQPGAAAVWVTLPGGTPLHVLQSSLQEPTAFTEANGPGIDGQGENRDADVVDIAGTTSAAILYPTFGYGFSGGVQAGSAVMVVNRGGQVTTWVAPEPITLQQLRTWAFAASS